MSDTIAAISTAQGPAGISIVRVSGPQAFDIALRIAGVVPSAPGLEARFARFRDASTGQAVDEGIVLLFKSPRSYTGEDVVEFQGHGGRIPSARLLSLAIGAGARLAEPGEFTRRAFTNGKIDLARAEATMDFIGASSMRAAAAAHDQLSGTLSKSIDAIYTSTVSVAADVGHLLDFDEYDAVPSFRDDAAERCRGILPAIDALLSSWRLGAWLREGAKVVLCGKPNVGKSSLMNALLGRDRAIVSPVAGTTRDTIEEHFEAGGIPVRLIDTAGLRDGADSVEAAGIARAEEIIASADIAIEVIDASGHSPASEARHAASAGRIPVLNKSDIAPREAIDGCLKACPGAVPVSAATGDGLSGLVAAIRARLDSQPGENADIAISERHRLALERARRHIADATNALLEGDSGLVPAASLLDMAANDIGAITGRVWSEDLLDSIFSRFCVGK